MENILTGKIIACAIEVHRNLGPGLLESAYAECLKHELKASGIQFGCELEIPLLYKDIEMNTHYRVDVFVEDEVIVELKAVDNIQDIHRAQLLTYLKLANRKFGLLINFNVPLLKDGVERMINKYYDPQSI